MRIAFKHIALVSLLVLALAAQLTNAKQPSQFADEEFSEFDDDSAEVDTKGTPKEAEKVSIVKDEESSIEIEDEYEATPEPAAPKKSESKAPKVKQNSFTSEESLDNEEFENFVDEEEFESYEASQKTTEKTTTSKPPDLKIAEVPKHLIHQGGWQNFHWEMVMLAIILIYTVNMLIGKSKNSGLANAWLKAHSEFLQKNFLLVGDDGSTTELPEEIKMNKECDHIYSLWCTGRYSCRNMYIQMKFQKRQDLVSTVMGLMRPPQSDQIIISVEYDKDDLDNFVFCLANKKISQNLVKDCQDLGKYCVEKKSAGDRFDIPAKYVMINEFAEVVPSILDGAVCSFLSKFPNMVEYLIVSDQCVGFKTLRQDAEQSAQAQNEIAEGANGLGLAGSRSVMVLCLNIGEKAGKVTEQDMENMHLVMQMALHLTDRLPRIKLSKEAKSKALKKRKEVSDEYLKIANKQRQEVAQQKKEEKLRAMKEKIMNENDPEKQKKLEEKVLKEEKKRSMAKMKQIKVKSM